MTDILNITNGDSAMQIMKAAGVTGEILPWRDVLHDGPVPGGLTLDELSRVRAGFIADCGWGEQGDIERSFAERDAVLESISRFDRLVLWFEHDLYDQLQILQILDWCSRLEIGIPVSMICTEHYLGMLDAEQMADMVRYEAPVTTDQLKLAGTAWQAFRSPDPRAWCDLLRMDTSTLPFLHDAVLRQLQEYPSCETGLSRTSRIALGIVADGESNPGKVFADYIETEQRKFMGDASFWRILDNMITAGMPLLSLDAGDRLQIERPFRQKLAITGLGRQVLAGEGNWLDLHDIDLWIGGVHLTAVNCWCWDEVEQCARRRHD